MPEVKRIFQGGKMNRTLDDRLVPNGEYREALNINVNKSDSSDVGAAENILGNVEITNATGITNGVCIGSFRDNGNERIYFFVTNNNRDVEDNPSSGVNAVTHGVFEYDQRTGQINRLAHGNWLNFHVNFTITGINFVDGLLFWTDNRNEPRKINVDRARSSDTYYNSDDRTAVMRFSPFAPPIINRISTTGNTSTFLEEKFVRFAYRYKYDDGEFSTISPFTPICFTSINSMTTSNVVGAEVPAFINQAKQVFIGLTAPPGFGITAIEVLYTESTSSNIYILDSIDVDTTGTEVVGTEYVYDSQDPFRTLPGDQLTRVYDAIPRVAQSQEFAGGRLIYGNYLQNYNIPDISFEATVSNKAVDTNDPFNRMSVKSRRTYQVGLVLADRYGRQTPVILSSTGGDTVYVNARSGQDAMQRIQVTINTDLPTWAHSYRVVVKQRQQEYYNVFSSYAGSGATPTRIIAVLDDNVNKIPRDPTQEAFVTASGSRAESSVKVFPKIIGALNQTGDSQLAVSTLRIANDGTRSAELPGLTASAPNTPVVVETIPRESELDIFYETSTGALVSSVTKGTAINVDFWNCYIINTTAGHVEANRIRCGFNEPWFTIGLKAFVVQENFAETRRFNTLIHSSGLFNSRVGINYVNQFNEAEGGITVSLDPADGSIQKLYAEDTQLLIFQEDKISRSPIDKDFIYSAEGGAVPVTSSTQYLGTIAPFAGEYGISTDPESFAVYGTRKYLSDRNRGVVLRLSNNGITEISNFGLSDFFRDALYNSTRVIGSYDEYHDHYNITIVGTPAYAGFEDTNVATARLGYFTVSFEDEANGWPSFKSFQQEGGLTLNNKYYTFNGGKLWEHDAGRIYNNFYGTQVESYIECIFNDGPSDVKEFKTVNYEGSQGWRCESVITEQDDLRRDLSAGGLLNAITASLNITSAVENGVVTGTNSQNVITGSQYYWVIKIVPTDGTYVFNATDDVTINFDLDRDGSYENISGALDETNVPTVLSNGIIYYVTPMFTAGSSDESYNVQITGGAVLDVSGSFLTINLADDNTGTPALEAFIPTDVGSGFASSFRAGPSTYSYIQGDTNTDVEIGIRFANNTDEDTYQLRDGGFTFDYSASVNSLLTGTAVTQVNSPFNTAYYRRALTLPSAATTGTVTVAQSGTKDPIIRRPQVTWSRPTITTTAATGTYTLALVEGSTETVWAGSTQNPTFIGYDGAVQDFQDTSFIVYPPFDSDDIANSYIFRRPTSGNTVTFGTDSDTNWDSTNSSITRITSSNQDSFGSAYKGGYAIGLQTPALTALADSATRETTNNITVATALNISGTDVIRFGDLALTLVNNGTTDTTTIRTQGGDITVDPSHTVTLRAGIDGLWSWRYYLADTSGNQNANTNRFGLTSGGVTYTQTSPTDSSVGTLINAGNSLSPAVTLTMDFDVGGTAITAGTYRLGFVPIIFNQNLWSTLYPGDQDDMDNAAYYVDLTIS